ncbi:hypothetical protein FRC0493_01513 [Corynebacterium diphtheriae]|nr:hypothetical protein FRC0493_01513 [Corynebacterium diphtheriae]
MTATHNHYLAVLGEDFVAQQYANEGYDITARNVSEGVRLFVCGGLGLQVVRESVGVSHG